MPDNLTQALENSLWRIELDPATLAIRVRPSGGPEVPVSAGVGAHSVAALEQKPTSAVWHWDGGSLRFEAILDGKDLRLAVRASSPRESTFLRQPAEAVGKGLILPLAEGSYVPANDAVWRSFLLKRMSEMNTTEDLSLPLWGLDHESFSLHWLITNPFNNTLTIRPDGAGVAMTFRHKFTKLAPDEPLTLILLLGGADLLAGAKRYRAWLIEQKRFEPLEGKLTGTPEARKLLGAAHVYLWGNGLLALRDVRDWPGFISVLRRNDAFTSDLRHRLDAEANGILAKVHEKSDPYQQRVLVRAVNAALNALARKIWQTADPDIRKLTTRYGELRRQVAEAFRSSLTDDPTLWGEGLSVATFARLRGAGLSRLWLGLGDGWEGGLWHPEAVRAGVKAGYLVAPYDSYETALPTGQEPDWATAHLGERAYRDGAIVLEDGSLKAGFRQAGHYTDPRYVRPLLKRRIQVIQAATGFNSWFLDAYAAGMVFDSYRPQAPLTQARMADANAESARWVSEMLKMPVGSESGNAVTARGIFFAHGMQTPVIGWGDPDMQRNTTSPYFLGGWYPDEQPSVFFKPVPMKEPYRTVYFEPTFRLPLYQAVFHDSVITTHHWQFDSLKLSDVRVENELTQLLYNVPPLYHLSADTLTERLPLIQRQDAFFRPLHERLATKALTGFRWLSPDRTVQETAFADGSRLVANFGNTERLVDGQRLAAYSVTAFRPGQPAVSYIAAAAPTGGSRGACGGHTAYAQL